MVNCSPFQSVSSVPTVGLPFSIRHEVQGIHWWNLLYFEQQDFVMSDSEDSTVTYTAVSSPFEGRGRWDDDESSDDDEDDDDDIKEDEDEEERPSSDDFVLPPVHRVYTWMSNESSHLHLLVLKAEYHHHHTCLVPYSSHWDIEMLYLVVRRGLHLTSHPPPLGTPPSGTPPLLPIPAPTSSPSLLLPSTNHGADRPEVCLPPRKRLYIALGPRYEVEENSSAPAARPTGGFKADYGYVATLDKEIRHNPEREVLAQQSEIGELRPVDRRRQTQFIEALKLLKTLQTRMTAFQRQQGPAEGPTQPDALEEAGSSS
ncbi:hypothetical protein Tco_0054485 [Tanacetum coccineum]